MSEVVGGKVFFTQRKPNFGQEIVIVTADNKLRLETKVTYISETPGGFTVQTGEGKMRYYPKCQTTYIEWVPVS